MSDRWHLFENASAAFLAAVRSEMPCLRRALAPTGPVDPATLTRAERIQWDGYQLREALNRQIIDLAGQGVPIRVMARTTGVSRKTIRKVLRQGHDTRLLALFDTGKLGFFGTMAGMAERKVFLRHLAPVRKQRWVVYAKPPFAGPQAVLAYLSRYTHRVAISNRRLIAFGNAGVTFRYKDYRRDGADRQQVMALASEEFIRRFLLHVLPRGFHRIRHYGLLSSSARRDSLALARRLLCVPAHVAEPEPDALPDNRPPCPCCGGHMTIVETFARWCQPRAPPQRTSPVRESAP